MVIWSLFLERPVNLAGPKSYFEIKVSRKVGCVLSSNEVHFVSFADHFTVQLSNVFRVRTGHGKPGKSWNFTISFSRPGKS